jgi:hypothetical protein
MNKKYLVLLLFSFVIIILLILMSSNFLLNKTTKKLPVPLPQLTLRSYTLIENQADGPNYLYAITADSDYIYLAGSCFNCGLKKNLAWQIEKRRKGDGQLDSKFGKNGKIIIDPTDYDDEAYAITVDSSFIYIVGIQGGESGNANWRIEKRDKVTGAYDKNFGEGGYIISSPTEGDNYAFSIINDDAFIYIVGSQPHNSPLSTHAWRIEKRNKVTGAYDKNFGEGGYIISNPVNEDNEAYSITVDDSFIYIAGLEGGTGADGKGFWRIEKRNKINGYYDSRFGQKGFILSDPTPFIDEARSLVVDDSFIYVCGYQSGNDYLGRNWAWRIEKRNKVTGAYDKNFGEGGYIISDPTTNNDLARSLYVDKDFIYIGGHQNGSEIPNQGDWAWRIEKRNKVTGAYDKNFGEGGSIVINPSEGDDFIYSIITDSSFVYFVGYQKGNKGNGNFWWRIEKRKKFDGQF